MREKFRATVVVSVYQGVAELNCALFALANQNRSDFEIIVSEDGESPDMANVVASWKEKAFKSRLKHATQRDLGFRKNRALNRAVTLAQTERIIFIDGDCVPTNSFVDAHLFCLTKSLLAAGRRLELGQRWTERFMTDPSWVIRLSKTSYFFALFPSLVMDGAKNPECGFRSKVLQRLAMKPTIDLVGCNFSCHKGALERVNGFNEEYTSPGLGEDSDLQERFKKVGVVPESVKYLAPLFHLFHPRNYKVSDENQRLYIRTKESELAHCRIGLREANQFNGDERASS